MTSNSRTLLCTLVPAPEFSGKTPLLTRNVPTSRFGDERRSPKAVAGSAASPALLFWGAGVSECFSGNVARCVVATARPPGVLRVRLSASPARPQPHPCGGRVSLRPHPCGRAFPLQVASSPRAPVRPLGVSSAASALCRRGPSAWRPPSRNHRPKVPAPPSLFSGSKTLAFFLQHDCKFALIWLVVRTHLTR